MKTFNIFLIGCCALIANVFGQQSPNWLENLRNVIPPSPNSASIAKYGDWPVSLYTGVPSISIPVTSVKARDLSVPISLNYHASGNRVAEVPSWVGLGWTLSAGGVISRSIKGLNDEEGYFAYSNVYSDPNDFTSTINNQTKLRVVNAARNLADSEQDSYNFSALGRSYRLILLADGTVKTIPHTNVKFLKNPIVGANVSDKEWIVILEDGVKLVFGGADYLETTDIPNFQAGDGHGIQFVSSWMLKSIESPSGEVVNFFYTNASITQDSYFSQSDFIKIKTNFHSAALGISCANVENSSNTKSELSKQTVSALFLSRIESPSVRIEFNSISREDLLNSPVLTGVNVFSKLSSSKESYKFNTSYSQSSPGPDYILGSASAEIFRKRLVLNSFERTASDGSSLRWDFEYNTKKLPSRRSYAQDHWGYFNGSANTTLLPKLYYAIPDFEHLKFYRDKTGFFPAYHVLGGDRTPNAEAMQAEMLTAIRYPTGGYSRFVYEPNSIPAKKELFEDETIELSINLAKGQPLVISRSGSFTLTKPAYVFATLESEVSQSILNDQPGAKASFQIRDSDGKLLNLAAADGQYSFNILKAGTYTFELSANVSSQDFSNPADYVNAVTTLRYPKSLGEHDVKEMTGGLRILSIEDFDGSSGYNKKVFEYEEALVINNLKEDVDYLTEQKSQNTNQTTGEKCEFLTVVRNTSTKFNSGNIQGGTTGYGKVTTFNGEGGTNGYTISFFNNDPDEDFYGDPHTFPYPPANSRDHHRGLLIREQVYSSSHTLLSEVEHTYAFEQVARIIGFKAAFETVYSTSTPCNSPINDCGTIAAYYGTDSEQVKLLSTKTKKFNENGSNPVVNELNYYYDNPSNLSATRIEHLNSKGQFIKTLLRTALEKDELINTSPHAQENIAAIDLMLSQNRINDVLQTEIYIDDTLTSRTTSLYKIFGNEHAWPTTHKEQYNTGDPFTSLTVSDYDSHGNPLTVTAKDGLTKKYIWDYNFTYPIAEIVGCESNDFAFTSFEADGKGQWSYEQQSKPTSAFTGKSSYALSDGSITKTNLTPTTRYTLTFWASGEGGISVNSVSPQPVRQLGNWQYYVMELRDQQSITITGYGKLIDELRLIPQHAQMTTYCFDPLVGISSKTDANGLTTTFQYDALNRPIIIRDDNNNILKKYEYGYKQN